MSWKATFFVKTLTHHKDGTKITARQKLILFVLADYHHEERGCAWVSLGRAAKESLTSRQWFITILQTLEKHGTIRIERREGKTNLYYFDGLVKPLDPPESRQLTTPVHSRLDHTSTLQTVPEPLLSDSSHIQPAAGWRPADYVLLAIEERKRTGQSTDEILKFWKDNPGERPLL